MALLIYTPALTNRVKYIFSFIFEKILGSEISFTYNRDEFLSFSGAKLNYSNQPLGDELFFRQCEFLLERGVGTFSVDIVSFQDYNICFPVSDSAMPFDVFAAAFFLISRHEEYKPVATDNHGRFKAEDSFAYRNGFVQIPVIDHWAYELAKVIRNRYPDFRPRKRAYSFIPTIDIDRAYAWKYSGALLTIARIAKALLTGNLTKAKAIISVLRNSNPDPFDTYRLMQEIHKEIQPTFFFLLGDRSRYDSNLPHSLAEFRNLISEVSQYAGVGIHPSYASNLSPNLLTVEKSRLENIIDDPISKSRQHFLKMELPLTYQRLLNAGIEEDYTMGFASEAGFRAGTCTPFNWYDLSQEKETNLTVYPFAGMDVTLRKYMALKPDEGLLRLKELCDNVRAVNGTFITLWHNESLTDAEYWKGWLNVYRKIVEYASHNDSQ